MALVDDDDYARLSRRKWCACEADGRVYAVSGSRKKKVLMHRLIMGAKKGEEIGHRIGIGLDNRNNNLVRVSRSQQRARAGKRKDNTSGAKGIQIRKMKNGIVYVARVNFQRKAYHGGTFRSLSAATAGYLKKAQELYGEFARSA